MKLSITKAVCIIYLLLCNNVFSHNEFYRLTGCAVEEVYAGSNENILKWQSYSNIPISKNFSLDFPSELFQSDCITDYVVALNAWNNVTFEDKTYDPESNFIKVRFIDDRVLFPYPLPGYREIAAGVLPAINDYGTGTYYLVGGNPFFECEDYRENWIVFNNCYDKTFYWTHNTYIDDDILLNFKYTLIHELGHEIGLAHCSFSSAIMYEIPPPAPYFVNFIPQSPDVQGVNIILGYLVGVEDYIEITSGPTQVTENSNATYYVGFTDNYPYGDDMDEFDWEMQIFHSDGVYVFDSGDTGIDPWVANLGTLPLGYCWLRDENDNVVGRVKASGFDDGGGGPAYHEAFYDIVVINIPNNITTHGTLSQNEFWCGAIDITGTLTIPVGISLNILRGTTINVDNSSNIYVYGTLNVQGVNPETMVVFNRSESSGTWGSIIFDGSGASSSIIDNANIMYASDIQCLNGANVTIQNSIIYNCTQGIYIYNSEPQILNNGIIEPEKNGIYGEASGKQPLIQGNEIIRTSSKNYQGIWFTNYTQPFITHNDVSGFHHAVYLGGGTVSSFTDAGVTSNPNNRLRNSRYGLTTGWGSTALAGVVSNYGGNNSIYNNSSRDVYSYQSSTVWALYNYWGGGAANGFADGSSYLYTSYWLNNDPWEGSSAPISKSGEVTDLANFNPELGSNPTGDLNPDIDDLLSGWNLERDGRINEAVLHYKQMVIRNSFIRPALTSLARITNRYDRNDLFNYFEQLVTDRGELKAILLRLLASMHLNGGNYNETLNIYDEIVTEYGESYEGVSARLDKLFAVLNYGKNIRLASNLLVELESLRISDEELLTRIEFANHLMNSSAPLNKGKGSLKSITEDNILKEYSLAQNYPNPFNPTTTMNYSIKQDGLVSLKVYDVLGSEIASLVNENQVAGNYSVQFDASSLPSGIYIYRLTSGQFTASKKLILLK